jgi:hypothetical protein
MFCTVSRQLSPLQAVSPTYLLMTSSLTPTVEEKKPTDQNSFRQYIVLIQGKRWRISRLVLALIFPTMADTAYFGGITITKWI